jgi:hypothetical protein
VRSRGIAVEPAEACEDTPGEQVHGAAEVDREHHLAIPGMKSMPLRPHGLIEVADEAGEAAVKIHHDTILSMQTKSVKEPRCVTIERTVPSAA